MRKALITGVSGFTGLHLARRLIEKGYEVHGLVRSLEKGEPAKQLGVNLHLGDLRDRAAVDAAIAGMDVVYHIAASYREASAGKSDLYDINVNGTRNVMESCLVHKLPRVVHCSTVGVHGEIENPPADEETRFAPGDEYQETKTQGEILVRDEFIPRGLPVVIYRPVGLHGPGDTRFLKLFKSIARGKFIMFGDGEVLYHLTYIGDAIEGIVACGETPGVEGQAFILCGPRATTLNELVEKVAKATEVKTPKIRVPFWMLWYASVACETLCKALGISPPLFRRRANWFKKDRSFNSAKARRLLNYSPKVELEESLRVTADWYRAQKLL